MRSSDDIKKYFKNATLSTNPETDQQVINQMLSASKKTTNNKSAIKLSTWRIIMTSRITKFATAAVLLLAVVLSIVFVDRAATPAYAISDLPRLFSEASSLHFKGCIYNHDSQEIAERPFEYWIDIKNAKSRQTHTGLITNGNKTTTTELEDIFNGKELVHINHTDKSVKYEYASEFYKNYFLKQNVDAILKQTINTIMEIGDFANVGKEAIGNIECEIWDGQFIHPFNREITIKAMCWLDPRTGDLCRMKVWYKAYNEENFKLGLELSHAERNIEINDSFFTFEPIPDYQYQNTKETATKATVPYVSSWYNHNIGLTLYTSFKLKNGSIILCWKCHDDIKERKDDILEHATFGGQIPETSISIVQLQALTANGVGSVYCGKHLASIKFEDNFCQWSIYTPEDNDYENVIAYSAIQKVNNETIKDEWDYNLTFTVGPNIDNQQDFDKLVLGAMSELSEDGVMPVELTYENVLKLVDKTNVK